MKQQAGIPARLWATYPDGTTAPLTENQYAAVMGVYDAFQRQVKNSIIPQHAKKLRTQGLEVEMTHLFGVNVVRVVVPLARREDGISGIGIETRDAQGNALMVILRPGGKFGESSGDWKETRVQMLSGGATFWQSSGAIENYSVSNDVLAAKNNAFVARLKEPAERVFSTTTDTGKKYIVSARSFAPYWADIKFYKGTLADLNAGPPKVLDYVVGTRLDKWTVIDAHQNGKKFLAAHYQEHRSPNGVVLWATTIDKLAWFGVGDGAIAEADTVLAHEFTVHYADPPLPYPDRVGDPVPTRGSFRYDYITDAHIGFDGKAVAHKIERVVAETNAEYDNSSPPVSCVFGEGTVVCTTQVLDEGNSYTNTDKQLFQVGALNPITLHDYLESSSKTLTGTWDSSYGSTFTQEVGNSVMATEISGTGAMREILFASPKTGLFVVAVNKLSAKKTITNTMDVTVSAPGSDYGRDEKRRLVTFNADMGLTVEVIRKNVLLRTYTGRKSNKSFEHLTVDIEAATLPSTPPVHIDPVVPLADRWIMALKKESFFLDCVYNLRGDSGAGLVAGASDPLTGAVVLQIVVDDALHWLAVDDTGVRDLPAVSKLIPPSEQALRIISV